MKIGLDEDCRIAALKQVQLQTMITPMEAAMAPAKERRPYGASRHVKQSFDRGVRYETGMGGECQRQKIWVM